MTYWIRARCSCLLELLMESSPEMMGRNIPSVSILSGECIMPEANVKNNNDDNSIPEITVFRKNLTSYIDLLVSLLSFFPLIRGYSILCIKIH